MKKFFAIFAAAIIACLAFCTACDDDRSDKSLHEISVSWSEGVDGATFTQNGERLMPVNGVISTESDENIEISVDLSAGYRQSQPTIKADGQPVLTPSVPATVRTVSISATPNAEISLSLGSGEGYRLDELKREPKEVGYTVIVGVFLEEGYREVSGPLVNVTSNGSEYEAVASLAPWGLDETALKKQGYHSFYKVTLLENAAMDVTGVVADISVEEEERYATVSHVGGEGYSLCILTDSNNDGISDGNFELSGNLRFLKQTVLNIFIKRADGYNAKNAKLFANGVEVVGTQGEGFDDSDPLSCEYIFPLTVSGDIVLTVEGVKKLSAFTLRIMNSDGGERYHTYCSADTIAQALAQIPGNDARDSGYYDRWWEPKPAGDYSFRIWHFKDGVYEEIAENFRPDLYENIYCGYVKDGETPSDPHFAPIIPPALSQPQLPSENLPESLKAAMNKVINDKSQTESRQWILAWASYKLLKAGVDVARPAAFGYENIFDAYMDDVINDYKPVAANDLWVYAYDMERFGSSEIKLESLKSSFINENNGNKRSWANQEAFVLEIVQGIFPEFIPKTSFTVGDIDDLNMTIMLILDKINPDLWSIGYGNNVKNYTKETYRQYVAENAESGVMANVVKEVYDYIGSIGV